MVQTDWVFPMPNPTAGVKLDIENMCDTITGLEARAYENMATAKPALSLLALSNYDNRHSFYKSVQWSVSA